MARALGILGGTFDPIHLGHLRLANYAHQALQLERVLLVPAGQPWQRRPQASAQARLQMVRLAAASAPHLQVETLELERTGPSYMVDTLHQLRAREGPACSLFLILGWDAFSNLATWHEWQLVPLLTHLVVISRPHWKKEALPLQPGLDLLWQARQLIRATTFVTDEVGGLQATIPVAHESPASPMPPTAHAGALIELEMPPHPASSTRIRAELAAGHRPLSLLPKAVLNYIETEQLYSSPLTWNSNGSPYPQK